MPKRHGQLKEHSICRPKGALQTVPMETAERRNVELAVEGGVTLPYQRALEPKKLQLISGGHFAPYHSQFDKTSGAAIAWFHEHLNSSRRRAQ